MEEQPKTVATAWIDGIEAKVGEVRVSTNPAGGALAIRGIPAETAAETRWRVYNALNKLNARGAANGLIAEIRPESDWAQHMWDLPVTLAVAQACGRIPPVGDTIIVGAVGANGKVTNISGTVPIARLGRETERTLMLPATNLGEASLADGSRLAPVASIEEAADWLAGDRETVTPARRRGPTSTLKLEDIAGQHRAKRALAIAATGRHHVLITTDTNGPAVGLAKRLPGLMPRPSADERHEMLAIHSLAALIDPTGGWTEDRPFRAPHWSASADAIATSPAGGRRRRPRPGEAALAHNGVLVLDEINTFGHETLNRVRGEMEHADHCASEYPSDFLLTGIVVTDDKPLEASSKRSRREAAVHALDQSRTGDLFDIAVDVEAAGRNETRPHHETTSATIQQMSTRVRRAREANNEGRDRQLSSDAATLLRATVRQHGNASGRRILDIATTIADIEAQGIATQIGETHLREALALRGILNAR